MRTAVISQFKLEITRLKTYFPAAPRRALRHWTKAEAVGGPPTLRVALSAG